MSRHRRYGGRLAKYPANANVWGRLAETKLDLNPDPPQFRPSPQEQAQAAFGALSQADQDTLTGWVVSNLTQTTPRAPWDGTAKTGLLGAATLAQEASQDLGQPITAAIIAGAALDLGFQTKTTARGLLFACDWKDS